MADLGIETIRKMLIDKASDDSIIIRIQGFDFSFADLPRLNLRMNSDLWNRAKRLVEEATVADYKDWLKG